MEPVVVRGETAASWCFCQGICKVRNLNPECLLQHLWPLSAALWSVVMSSAPWWWPHAPRPAAASPARLLLAAPLCPVGLSGPSQEPVGGPKDHKHTHPHTRQQEMQRTSRLNWLNWDIPEHQSVWPCCISLCPSVAAAPPEDLSPATAGLGSGPPLSWLPAVEPADRPAAPAELERGTPAVPGSRPDL